MKSREKPHSSQPAFDPERRVEVGGYAPPDLCAQANKNGDAWRETEQQFRAIFDVSSVGMAVADRHGRFLRVNGALCEMTGYTEAELVGMPYASLTHLDDLAADTVKVVDLIAGRTRDYQSEKRYLRKDGSVLWVNVVANLVRDAAGHPVNTVAVMQDITARKQAEESMREANDKLRESERRFRVMADAVPALVWATTPDGHVDFLSRQWRTYTGVSHDPSTAAEFIGSLIHPDDRPLTMERFNEARRTGTTYQVEHRIRSAAGKYRWFLARGEPYRDAQTGQILRWFGASIDIHDRKLAEQAVGKAKAELQEHAGDLEAIVAERTASLRESLAQMETFSYTVSHDLRSPLRAMQAFAHLCLEEYGNVLDGTGRDYLKRIDTAAKRMDALIQDVIAYDKMARADLRMEPVDTERLVEEVIQQYPSVNRPHASFEIARPLYHVLASPAALVQALSNLLTNAVKFVGAGQKATVKIWTEKTDSTVRLYVEDNGIGIPQEALSNVFQPFHRAHASSGYEGTGIGLAVVKKAVERMDGRLGVESEVGRGSKFWIELPASS